MDKFQIAGVVYQTHRIHVTGIFTYISVFFNGFHVGKYASPINPIGKGNHVILPQPAPVWHVPPGVFVPHHRPRWLLPFARRCGPGRSKWLDVRCFGKSSSIC